MIKTGNSWRILSRLFHYYYEIVLIKRNYTKLLISRPRDVPLYRKISSGKECCLIEREIYSRRSKKVLERLVCLSEKGHRSSLTSLCRFDVVMASTILIWLRISASNFSFSSYSSVLSTHRSEICHTSISNFILIGKEKDKKKLTD
jgi:hypothetical protein